MNNHVEVCAHSPWHVGSWFQRIHRMLGNPRAGALCTPVLPLTRRQELMAAQDLKKREQRSREFAMLREMKTKGQCSARDTYVPPRITGN